ncbi:MAG: histidine phosphatase family protein [Dermatophilaceae bacterium]
MTTSTPGRDHQWGSLVLVRHGETEWSRTGRHTGRTDVPLTARGEMLGSGTHELLRGRVFALVLSSPLQRARRTAQLAGLVDAEIDDNLMEWDYGGYEGLTTNEIGERVGHPWTVFEDGVIPGATPGESIEDVAARCRKVIKRVEPVLEGGDVALVGHGHCLRILAAVFLGQEPRLGSQILLDAGSVSVLGWERAEPVIISWNRTLT